MQRTLCITLALLIALLCVPATFASENGSLGQWTDRLESLTPDDPEGYFRLAEEMAALGEGPDDRDRDLLNTARRLFVLAFELDRKHGDGRLGASACLGLVGLAMHERERRWLRALAATLDPRHALPDWSRIDPSTPTTATALRAAEAIGQVRSGNGRAASALLDDPAVLAALSRHDRLLHPMGARGGLVDLQRQANLWPCPECRNSRLGRDARGRPSVCGTCNGNPGPELTPARYAAHLRTEFSLLSAEHSTWSSQLATDGGAPLRDPDPDELSSAMRIDPSRTLYRGGRWVRPEGAAEEQQDEPEPDSSAPPQAPRGNAEGRGNAS